MSVQQYSIFINNQEVDISEEDLSLSFNYQLADIQEPEKRKTNFSKSIVIPGTQDNNNLFSHIFDVSKSVLNEDDENFSPDFNPNLKADIIIYKGSVAIFEGFCRLLDITINERGFINYNINAIGELINIFSQLKDKELTDIDLSEYDHDFNLDNIENSWETSIIRNDSDLPFQIGRGYVYPLINYGYNQLFSRDETQTIAEGNVSKFNITNFFPSFYVKEYIDKIFEDTDFTYTSNFFNSERFKRLIIPFDGGLNKLSPGQKVIRKFRAERNNSNSNSTGLFLSNDFPGAFSDKIDYKNEIFDSGNTYNVGNSRFSPPSSGDYKFTADTTFDIDAQFVSEAFIFKKWITIDVWLQVWLIKSDGRAIKKIQKKKRDRYGNVANDDDPNRRANYKIRIDDRDNNSFYLETNDQVEVRYKIKPCESCSELNDFSLDYLSIDWTVKSEGVFANKPLGQANFVDSRVEVNSVIPKKIKQSDFLKDIITMFNLYVLPSKDNPKNLIIEPYPDFYKDEVVDWTDKIDLNKKINIKPASRIESKEYVFKYKEDEGDYWLDKYRSIYQTTYGEKRHVSNNEFVNDEKEFNVNFSMTPLAQHGDISGLYMSEFIQQKKTDNGEFKYEARNGNIRILYYGGIIHFSGTGYPFNQTQDQWRIIRNPNKPDPNNDRAYNKFPYAGHVDNPVNPKFTLEWYYSSGYFFNNNKEKVEAESTLYTEYYRNYLQQINSKNSKVVKMSVNLDAKDIFDLDFQKLIHIDGNNYILNKIEGYNPFTNSSTSVELFLTNKRETFDIDIEKQKSSITINQNQLSPPITGLKKVGSNKFNIIEGGEDEVRDISATTDKFIIEGGEDEVRSISSTSDIIKVNGGKNTV